MSKRSPIAFSMVNAHNGRLWPSVWANSEAAYPATNPSA